MYFLNSLEDAVVATDEACGPFYDQGVFKQPSLNCRVSTAKWAEICRSVAKHGLLVDTREKLLREKQHDEFRRKIKEKHQAVLRAQKRLAAGEAPTGRDALFALISAEQTVEAGNTMRSSLDSTAAAVPPLNPLLLTEDIFEYPVLKLPEAYGLSLLGMARLLRDTRITFCEIVDRLRALSQSEALKMLGAPPPMPPEAPEIPCPLCHRVDSQQHAKNQRADLIEKILADAREKHQSLTEVLEKAQKENGLKKEQIEKLKIGKLDVESRLADVQQKAFGMMSKLQSFGVTTTDLFGDESALRVKPQASILVKKSKVVVTDPEDASKKLSASATDIEEAELGSATALLPRLSDSTTASSMSDAVRSLSLKGSQGTVARDAVLRDAEVQTGCCE